MNPKTKLPKIDHFHFDPILVVSSSALLLIGYIMVTSSSLHIDGKISDNLLNYPAKQLVHIFLGIIFAKYITGISLRSWEKIGPWLFILGLFLLVVVLIPGLGIKVNGSTRWLSLGGIRVQVSEVIKFASVIYMAGYVNRHQQAILESALGLLKPLVLFMIAGLLLLCEPDMGSAVIIVTIATGIMFLAGARLIQFISLIVALAIVAALLAYIEPYRWGRVTSFINPWVDAKDSGFQLVNALISFGRGEIFGVGLGNGVQKLFYLPEAHTDFIFSVIAEELGLVGVIVIVTLFSVLIWRIFYLAHLAEQANDKFAAFVAYGVGIWFGFQTFVNVGVNMGILPTKGLTLPLMSYGGGSMIIMCGALGLLFRVYYEITEHNASNIPTPRVKAARAQNV